LRKITPIILETELTFTVNLEDIDAALDTSELDHVSKAFELVITLGADTNLVKGDMRWWVGIQRGVVKSVDCASVWLHCILKAEVILAPNAEDIAGIFLQETLWIAYPLATVAPGSKALVVDTPDHWFPIILKPNVPTRASVLKVVWHVIPAV
jgi:hypothetical protein